MPDTGSDTAVKTGYICSQCLFTVRDDTGWVGFDETEYVDLDTLNDRTIPDGWKVFDVEETDITHFVTLDVNDKMIP